MRGWLAVLLIGMTLLVSADRALAQTVPGTAPASPVATPSAAQLARQARRAECSAEAARQTLSGDARRGFLRECRVAAGAPEPTAPNGATRTARGGETPAMDAAVPTQQDRMRGCNAEARTQAISNEARRDFMRECLSRRRAAVTATTASAPLTRASVSGPGRAVIANTAASYRSEAEAKAACAEDQVVWGNSDSRIFHLGGARLYGNTQNGTYLCRSAAELAGYRGAR